jgi:putative ABC transport system ATP-binding protein
VHTPAVVWADEPTGNLDTESTESVMELLVRLNRDEGQSIVLVTHNPSVAALTARTIGVRDGLVENGRLAGQAAGVGAAATTAT